MFDFPYPLPVLPLLVTLIIICNNAKKIRTLPSKPENAMVLLSSFQLHCSNTIVAASDLIHNHLSWKPRKCFRDKTKPTEGVKGEWISLQLPATWNMSLDSTNTLYFPLVVSSPIDIVDTLRVYNIYASPDLPEVASEAKVLLGTQAVQKNAQAGHTGLSLSLSLMCKTLHWVYIHVYNTMRGRADCQSSVKNNCTIIAWVPTTMN